MGTKEHICLNTFPGIARHPVAIGVSSLAEYDSVAKAGDLEKSSSRKKEPPSQMTGSRYQTCLVSDAIAVQLNIGFTALSRSLPSKRRHVSNGGDLVTVHSSWSSFQPSVSESTSRALMLVALEVIADSLLTGFSLGLLRRRLRP